jgi:hypothetical protein
MFFCQYLMTLKFPGICAIDLVSPYELLLWTVIDSHSYVDTMALLQAYQVGELYCVVVFTLRD